MTRKIAVANQKGGVGKTTTSVNLAAALSTLNKSILLVDLDPQGNATMGCGIDKYTLSRTIAESLVDPETTLSAICKTELPGLSLLPSNADLTATEVALLEFDDRHTRLQSSLSLVEQHYDYILIDCPPALNILTLNAFVASDSVLIPIQCEYYALEGLTALLSTIDDVTGSVNPNLEIEGLLRTMFDSRNNLANEVSDQLIEHFPDKVFKTVVPRNIRLAEAPSFGQSILQYDRSSRGALAYLALAGELVRKQAQQKLRQQVSVNDTAANVVVNSGSAIVKPTEQEADHG